MVDVRQEREDDEPAIDRVLRAAFDSDDEVSLVRALRSSAAWIEILALVAEIHGDVVGYCLTTRAQIGDLPALALGPLAVDPRHQRSGVGSALMLETIELAREREEVLVGLLGEPAFYGRFGFVPSSRVGIPPPVAAWGDHFQVLVMGAHEPGGSFMYPDAFEIQ